MDSEEILIEFVAKSGDRSQGGSIQSVNAKQLKNSIHKLVSLVHQIAADAPKQNNELSLDEVEVSIKITDRGEVVLLGDGQSNGAMKLRFRRSGYQDGATIGRVSGAAASSLISSTGVDYSKLQSLLASAKWQEANQETWNLMCQAAHKKVGSVLSTEEIKQISCHDLKMIDQLWQQYSQGRYGFSAQNQVYMSSILG